MTERPSLLSDIGNYLTGRIVLVFLGFATFPLMTRMLTVSQYGVLSLTLRIVLLLTVLSKCGLQYSAARFYDGSVSSGAKSSQQRFYSTLTLGPLLTAAAVIAVYLPILLVIRGYLADPVLYTCLLVSPVLVLLRTLQSLLLGMLRNEGRSKLHSILEVTSKALTLCALFALVALGWRSAAGILAATAASEGAIVVVQLSTLLRRHLLLPRALDWTLIQQSLAFGAPLIVYELSSVVLDSGDRFLVRHYLGDTSLGYYSAAYNISGYLQDTVMTPLNLAIFPIYMRLWNEDGREATQRFLSHALSWFMVVAIAIIALTLLCSQDMIILLASNRFIEARRLLPILVPSLMLYATHIFLNVGLILQKRTVLMSIMVGATALVNLLLNVVMIPNIGLTGAAWATLASYALLIGCLAMVNQRILPLRPHFGLVAQASLAAAGAFILPAQIQTHLPALTLACRVPLYLALFALLLLLLSKTSRNLAGSVAARAFQHRPSSTSSSASAESGLRAPAGTSIAESGRS